MPFLNLPLWEHLALPFFLVSWMGYTFFAKFMSTRTHCLASVLEVHRTWWMERMLLRDNRVADAALLANIERNVNFFASTTLLIIAATLTALTADFEFKLFAYTFDHSDSQLKLALMLGIMVYAFFAFTWSLRQYGFVSVLIGAAPTPGQDEFSLEQRKEYAHATGKVLDQAGKSYNYGLRSYYFTLAILAWFVHPLLFLLATATVVSVLYMREFHSEPLKYMAMDVELLKTSDKD
ncbi:MAG: DUF599 domain-containing protein [Pseudomonadales bacterium]|nr:DUF599 domain-containing protein [Pseudomonadales bacterium]